MSGGARRAADALGVWALALTVGPLGCRGPRPELGERAMRVDGEGRAWVTVCVRNAGGGEGSVEVRATLLDGDGVVVGKGTESLDLAAHEEVHVTVPVGLDPQRTSSAAAALTASVEVSYPPD